MPAAQLTGEKWLRKGVDIGNQQSQDIGILYPYRIDNFCKIVCGFRHFGRYTDDSYIIHRSKEKLLQAFEGIKKIAAEFGLIINERKTRICKLSDTYRHLQIQYSLTASGRLIRKINPKAVTRERRRLKAYKRLLDAGRMAYSKIEESFKSWIASVYKYMSRQQIQGLSRLFYDLFGKAPNMEKNARKQPWTVTLDDGTAIGGLTLSGNNFISDTELTPEMFDGKLSKITATDGDSTLEWNNAELVQITHPDSRWWFVLRELSPEELFRATTKAKLDYLALVTDTDLEDM